MPRNVVDLIILARDSWRDTSQKKIQDNISTINMVSHEGVSERSKHIDIL